MQAWQNSSIFVSLPQELKVLRLSSVSWSPVAVTSRVPSVAPRTEEGTYRAKSKVIKCAVLTAVDLRWPLLRHDRLKYVAAEIQFVKWTLTSAESSAVSFLLHYITVLLTAGSLRLVRRVTDQNVLGLRCTPPPRSFYCKPLKAGVFRTCFFQSSQNIKPNS